ncbi:MAG: formate dehydrogenase subunit gamma [Acidimicrobiales bacterium]
MPEPSRRPEGTMRLLRFDRVQRTAHWANAVLFFILVATALPLYFSSIERVVGRHVLIEEIHVWTGVAWAVPIIVSLVGPWGARMRRDVRRFNRWTRQEIRWLRSFGAERIEKDKFNPGQKLNAIFTGGAIVVMLGSGIVMKWFGYFPVSWRSGSTFVHEVLAFIVVAVVIGHIVMALTHWESLRSMFRGWVSVPWARRNAPLWAREEITGASPAERADDRPRAVTVSGVGGASPPSVPSA